MQDVAGSNYYVNNEGKLIKTTKKEKERIICSHIEIQRIGRGEGSPVAQDKQDAWDTFTK